MIQPNEIRIGNWVIGYDDKPFRWEIGHFKCLWDGTGGLDLDEIIRNPIPLTEDVLLKCGAKRLFENTYSVGNIIVSLKNGIALLNSEGFPLLGKCEYLHQLQNIWFARWNTELRVNLTNQELEIEL